jgi:hypothetical protein
VTISELFWLSAVKPQYTDLRILTSAIDQIIMVYACPAWGYAADILVFLLYLYLTAFLNCIFLILEGLYLPVKLHALTTDIRIWTELRLEFGQVDPLEASLLSGPNKCQIKQLHFKQTLQY